MPKLEYFSWFRWHLTPLRPISACFHCRFRGWDYFGDQWEVEWVRCLFTSHGEPQDVIELSPKKPQIDSPWNNHPRNLHQVLFFSLLKLSIKIPPFSAVSPVMCWFLVPHQPNPQVWNTMTRIVPVTAVTLWSGGMSNLWPSRECQGHASRERCNHSLLGAPRERHGIREGLHWLHWLHMMLVTSLIMKAQNVLKKSLYPIGLLSLSTWFQWIS